MTKPKFFGLRVAVFYLAYVAVYLINFTVTNLKIYSETGVGTPLLSLDVGDSLFSLAYQIIYPIISVVIFVALGRLFASLRHDAHRAETRGGFVRKVLLLHMPALVPIAMSVFLTVWSVGFQLHIWAASSIPVFMIYGSFFEMLGCLIFGCGLYDLNQLGKRKKAQREAERLAKEERVVRAEANVETMEAEAPM